MKQCRCLRTRKMQPQAPAYPMSWMIGIRPIAARSRAPGKLYRATAWAGPAAGNPAMADGSVRMSGAARVARPGASRSWSRPLVLSLAGAGVHRPGLRRCTAVARPGCPASAVNRRAAARFIFLAGKVTITVALPTNALVPALARQESAATVRTHGTFVRQGKRGGGQMPATVLAVHSEAEALNMMVSAMRTAGYDVAGFSDPLAALDAIEADSCIRVLVTRIDFGSGKLNGVALVRMLRHNLLRDIRVIFVGRSENGRYLDDGVGEFVPHPVDPTALINAVGRMLLEESSP